MPKTGGVQRVYALGETTATRGSKEKTNHPRRGRALLAKWARAAKAPRRNKWSPWKKTGQKLHTKKRKRYHPDAPRILLQRVVEGRGMRHKKNERGRITKWATPKTGKTNRRVLRLGHGKRQLNASKDQGGESERSGSASPISTKPFERKKRKGGTRKDIWRTTANAEV